MIRTVLVVPVDGTPHPQLVDNSAGFLAWLYQTCDTRIVEHVQVAEGVGVYGDEEGRMHGCPVNAQATALVAALIEQDGHDMAPGWDLVGTVVFAGDADEEGMDGSVPDRVLDLAGLR